MKPKAGLIAVAAACLSMAGPAGAQSGADVVKAKGCLGCHDLQTKKVGPAYKDVAAKYKGDSKAAANLAAKLKEGTGHPVKFAGSDAELKAAIGYVLSTK